jgi:tetratricopeptide (TPR) repeat protein
MLYMFLLTVSTGDSLTKAGDLPAALPVLLEETIEDPTNPWLLYRYAWVCNRMEKPEDALEPALAAWRIEPSSQWYFAEYLRALRSLEMFEGLLEYEEFVRGGGVCRYYLAAAERELGIEPSPSLGYLLDTSSCGYDSAAADACIWLAILLQNEVNPDSVLTLVETAVNLQPDEDFYRCVLAEKLAENGEIERSREQLHLIRLEGSTGYSYWQSYASLAEAEEDADRRIWALRRARADRICPESSRNLGWALYISGRNKLRDGDLVLSRERLLEAVCLADTSEIYVQKSDSLLELIDEFENSTSDNY